MRICVGACSGSSPLRTPTTSLCSGAGAQPSAPALRLEVQGRGAATPDAGMAGAGPCSGLLRSCRIANRRTTPSAASGIAISRPTNPNDTRRRKRKHQPDRVELDARSDDARRQHIVSQGFPEKEDAADSHQRQPVRPELGRRHAHRDDKTAARSRYGTKLTSPAVTPISTAWWSPSPSGRSHRRRPGSGKSRSARARSRRPSWISPEARISSRRPAPQPSTVAVICFQSARR